jgi:hypothetical protein
VYYGPDKGLSLQGDLKLQETKAGQLSGMLVRNHGSTVLVSGQRTGVAINLVFYLGHNKHIFGVGTFGQDPGATQWFVGGPLVGPNKADAGDWGVTGINVTGDWGFPHPWD